MRTASVRLPGHPDAACDLVVEAVVDEYLRRDPAARLRIAATGGRGVLFLSGDVISDADFDVSAIVKRTLGEIGVDGETEVFVSLEPVPAERVANFKNGEEVVTVIGYATKESADGVPQTVSLARRVAKRLAEKRTTDPEWFWLGPDAEVTVLEGADKKQKIIVSLEHGNEPLVSVRNRIAADVASIVGDAVVVVNPQGAREARGLRCSSGASGRTPLPYGSFLPAVISGVGVDPRSAGKAGTWLARAAARKIVAGGVNAALVSAIYLPGELTPTVFSARDERGRDMTSQLTRDDFRIDRVMKDWWRNGLNSDATRWGFAGEAGLPWEE